MSLLKRFAYYFGGFAIGVLILLFILDKKNASCDYSPTARVLKNISTKEYKVESDVLYTLTTNSIAMDFIPTTLKNGEVLFKESQTQLDSCNIYVIRGKKEWKNWKLSVENCDSIVKVLSIDPVK